MAADKTYTLVIEFDGQYPDECAEYDPAVDVHGKGAGMALAELEKRIRTLVYNASNTYAKVKSLTRQ
jgi:hypothetical protein